MNTRPALYVLFFFSGLAALVFEVLWLRDLGLLFGNTAYATATTLSVFFLGLAAGGYVWGLGAPSLRDPLRTYAALELAVALSSLLYLGLLTVYRVIYEPVIDAVGHGALFRLVKLLLAAGMLFPPAFFMGGTFPVLAEHLVRRRKRAGWTGSLLYASNTVGAAIGALLAGFYLPRAMGIGASYRIGIATAAGVALAAYLIAVIERRRGTPRATPAVEARRQVVVTHPQLGVRLTTSVAFLSGFATLGLQVLWTRLLAQVLNNSVYAFAAILVTFLAALAAGAVLAYVIARAGADPPRALAALCGLASLTVLLSPLVFVHLTQGLSYVGGGVAWPAYVRAVFTAAAVLMLVPGILVGSVLPFLFRVTESTDSSVGPFLGRLVAANSIGAIIGSLTAGFVLLDAVGLWTSVAAMSSIYLGVAGYIVLRRRTSAPAIAGTGALGLSVLATALASTVVALPAARLRGTERLEQVWEGSGGTVSVIRDGGNLIMRVNNNYTLGDTRSLGVERMQAHLPLLLHPRPRAVFFLGLGTGITVGAALDHSVQRVVAAELIPDVIAAAREYFAPYTNGAFRDPRVVLLAEDGRSYLAGTREPFDVIVGDLFTPWHAGTGSLYTAEHFRTVRSRLRPGGIFAQWLPLSQLSAADFLTVAHTMASVFPQVTLWRADFSPSGPIVALIARADEAPLEHAALARNVAALTSSGADARPVGEHMAGLFYAGNLTRGGAVLRGYPINTDDRPLIEFRAPRTESDTASRLTGARLARFYDRLLKLVPPERDPLLRALPQREREYVSAGLGFYKYHVFAAAGQRDSAYRYLADFLEVVPTQPGDATGARLWR